MKSIVLICILCASLFSLNSKAEVSRPGVQGQRLVDTDHNWIGKLNINDRVDCTAWLLKHGVAVTAKHCFLHKDLNELLSNQFVSYFSIEFSDSDGQALNIPLTSVQFDQGSNDIVYLMYDKTFTEDTIKFNHTLFIDEALPNTPINLAGYTETSLERIVSINCKTTGFQNDFPATKMDPGYTGVFEDTTCPSWYGVSGGPVFSVDPITKSTIIYGVVTHTFDILESGEPNSSLIITDEFGESLTTMYSPFSSGIGLERALNTNG